MKKCIWDFRTEENATFNTLAHTIPHALGGLNICENVCDDCNNFFSRYYKRLPGIETVLKETFNISRARLLGEKEIGRNKVMPKVSSVFFKVDFIKHQIDLKLSYRFHACFQENISRLFRRGIYKIYLEELERQKGTAHDARYDFIRKFARYDLDNLPVFYFVRKDAIIPVASEFVKNPVLHMDKEYQFQFMVQEPGYFEFELLGHVFGIVTSPVWLLTIDSYLKKTWEAKKNFFRKIKVVKNFNDVDLTLSILDDYHMI